MRNKIIIITLILITPFTGFIKLVAQTSHEIRWEVQQSSTLSVDGKSNVNSFSCRVNKYPDKDTLVCQKGHSNEISFTGELQMEVTSFNCHNSIMTSELRKIVKAKEYPVMTIHFLSLESMPLFKNKVEVIKGWVEVTLAGINKKFELDYSFENESGNALKLNGIHTFLFSDFKLSPPRKLGGLIRIKNDFEVNFQLLLRSV